LYIVSINLFAHKTLVSQAYIIFTKTYYTHTHTHTHTQTIDSFGHVDLNFAIRTLV